MAALAVVLLNGVALLILCVVIAANELFELRQPKRRGH